MKRLSSYLLLVIALATAGATLLPHGTAAALSGSQFSAGHIIDDNIFYDGTSMSTNEVQNFLNSKVPTCDTNGTTSKSYYYNSSTGRVNNSSDTWVTTSRATYGARYDKYYKTTVAAAPYTCLKNYKQNTPAKNAESGICGNTPSHSGRTAAAIITDIGAACGVSPKVLIVLLQKEQGLVTDVWPWDNEYQKATGFACPDSGSCNTAYYGFFNQVYSAARQFKRYRADPTNWNYVAGQSNKIYYDVSTSCGYSWVNIVNQATAGLYDYTPYQPNKAALDNLYGTGNSCSAYGNRNFWRYFNDWFGSPVNPVFTIKGQGSTAYLNWGSTYYPIPSMDVLRAYGLQNDHISTVDAASLNSMTEGQPLSTVATFGTSSTAYFIDGGKYYSIPSMAMLNAYGYPGSAIKTFSDPDLMTLLSPGQAVTSLARTGSGGIYYIENGNKHLFPDNKTFTTLGPSLTGDSSLKFNTLSDYTLSKLTESSPELLEGSIFKAKDSDSVYLYENSKRWPFTYAEWVSWGKPLDYKNFSSSSVNAIPANTGSVPILVTDGTNYYLANGGKKLTYSGGMMTTWGLTNSNFTQLSSNSLGRLGSAGQLGSLVGSSGGTVYVVRSGEKLAIPSADDFTRLGYKWSQVQTLADNDLSLVSTSTAKAFGPGSLVLLPNNSVTWIDTNYTQHAIPSLDVFNAYGFNWKNVHKFDAASVSIYTNSTLYPLTGSASSHFLMDLGKKHSVSSSMYASGAYNFGSTQQTTLSATVLGQITNGTALTQFIQAGSSTVYKVVSGQKHPIASPSALFANGGSWSSITKVSSSFASSIPTGTTYN